MDILVTFPDGTAELRAANSLCAEIAEADRPCLTCEANAFPLPEEPTEEDR